MVKRPSTMWDIWVRSLGRKIPWRRKWQPTPILLPRKSHGWRSLVQEEPGAGYCPWGRKESDMTERLHFHFIWIGGWAPPQSEMNVTQEMMRIKIWHIRKNVDWGGDEEPEAKKKLSIIILKAQSKGDRIPQIWKKLIQVALKVKFESGEE